MTKKKRPPPEGRPRQLSVFVTEEAWRRLAALQKHYATGAGLPLPMTQPDAIERVLRDAAIREGVEKKGTK